MDFETRNMAQASCHISTWTNPEWKDWNLEKATKEGLKSSAWVFIASKLVADAVSSVPLVVYDKESKIVTSHPVHKLLDHPHPDMSRADIMRLIAIWLQLSGEAYFKKASGVRGIVKELWPISPDRICPVVSEDSANLISGYKVQLKSNQPKSFSPDYTLDSVIRVCIADPADPVRGISPLMAAAKAVDVDNLMQEWNNALLKNGAKPSFAIGLEDVQTDVQRATVSKSIAKFFGGAKKAGTPLVLAAKTVFHKLGFSQTDMDFSQGLKNNRDVILASFGVPIQLVSTDASSYNNISEAKRIFWMNTVIPLINLIVDAFNRSLKDQLGDGFYIKADYSQIDALRESEDAKLDRAGKFFKLGVPVKVINDRLELGLTEYPDWEKPFGGRSNAQAASAAEDRSAPALEKRGMTNWSLMPTELRNIDKEIDRREEMAQKHMKPAFEALLDEQRNLVFGLIDDGDDLDGLDDELHSISERHIKGIRQLAIEAAVDAGKAVVVAKKRSAAPVEFRDDSNVALRIASLLTAEHVIEVELGFLNASSVEILTALIADSRAANETVQQLKDRLTSGGFFGPDRALRVARTLTGAVSSVGQIASAEEVGAGKKIWNTSGGARDGHAARAGEVRPIDGRFSSHYGGSPRWPLDSSTTTKDRVNCRCSLSFSE